MLFINNFNKTQFYKFKVGFYYLIGVFSTFIDKEVLLWMYVASLQDSIIIQTWSEYNLQIFRHVMVFFIFNTFELKQLCFKYFDIKVNHEAKCNFVFHIHCIGFFFRLLKLKHIRDPPFRRFIKIFEWRILMTNIKDYTPLIRVVKEHTKYFIEFKDVHMKLNRIQVTEEVFLQFFGIHQHNKDSKKEHYYIAYENHEASIKKEVTKEEYCMYQSFRSIEIREQHIYDRYLEHYEQTELMLYHKRMLKDHDNMVDLLYKEDMVKALYKAIASLSEVQRRRLILHYIDGLSLAQIAQKEHCAKSSIQCSIRIALHALYARLEKFKD